MARLLFSSEGLTAATDAIQQLHFCCFLSLSNYMIGTYTPIHLPTDLPTHILSHTDTHKQKRAPKGGRIWAAASPQMCSTRSLYPQQ